MFALAWFLRLDAVSAGMFVVWKIRRAGKLNQPRTGASGSTTVAPVAVPPGWQSKAAPFGVWPSVH